MNWVRFISLVLINLPSYSTVSIQHDRRDGELKGSSKSKHSDGNSNVIDQVQSNEDMSQYNFGIMIDAGSTGSRIFIYEWDSKTNCKLIPYIKPSLYREGPNKGKQFSIKKSGGLANVNPADIPGYFKDLITPALQFIPVDKRTQTPIFLKATAGMRTISRVSANRVLDATKLVLGKSGFKFDEKFGAQIIPGEFEGVFGWLAVNFLTNVFSNPSQKLESKGYLDMGGSSTQITFEPNDIPIENSFPINLNGTSKIIYTHSYLKFGRNDAQSRYYKNLLKASHIHGNGNLVSPCTIKGHIETQLIDSQNITISGQSSFDDCLKQTLNLLNKGAECFTSNCAINGEFISEIPSQMDIYAISTFFETSKFFSCSGKKSIKCILENAQKQCNLDLQTYLKNNEKFKNEYDFMNYCFNAGYIINLLKEGYGLGLDRELIFTSSVDEINIGWTLGAMIYEVNLLREKGQCCDKENEYSKYKTKAY